MRLARAARKMLRPKWISTIVPDYEVPVVPECDVEQLWTERVFVAVTDRHTQCAKNAIDCSMLQGEGLIVCQSDRTMQRRWRRNVLT
jgi:hypothetical protein